MAIVASKEIRRAVDTGKVIFGLRGVEKTILTEKGEIVIVSSNIPKLTKERLKEQAKHSNIPLYGYEGNAKDLGAICGKPFVVSALLVKDTGKSNVMQLAKEQSK